MRKLPYVFTPRELAAVARGEITMVLAMVKHGPHARRGETVRLEASEPGHPAFLAHCSLRARIVLAPDGLLRVSGETDELGDTGMAMLLHAAEQAASQAPAHLPRLAARIGHAGWADLYAREKARQGRGGRILREVIGWNPATLEKAAR